MPKREVYLFDEHGSPWRDFLDEFLEDTASSLRFFDSASKANREISSIRPELVFLSSKFVSPALAQKLKVLRVTTPGARIFCVGGDSGASRGFDFDGSYGDPPEMKKFRKELVHILPMPETIRLLVIDDEAEVGAMVKDFFEGRRAPAFEVSLAENGEKGLRALIDNPPDVALLDIKMPVKDGREVYREIHRRGLKVPVIIFFDAIFGDEIAEIHKVGRPAVVEKGSKESSPPELMNLVKKIVLFS